MVEMESLHVIDKFNEGYYLMINAAAHTMVPAIFSLKVDSSLYQSQS